MSALPFMNMFWSDYFSDTRHLTCEQHGAYLQLIGSLWIAGGSLPSDPKKLAKIASCSPSRWARIEAEVMAFFDVKDGTISHTRVSLELKKAREKSIKRAEVGSLGGRAKSLKSNKTGVAIATGLLKHPEPEPEYKGKPLQGLTLIRRGKEILPLEGQSLAESQIEKDASVLADRPWNMTDTQYGSVADRKTQAEEALRAMGIFPKGRRA